MNAPKKMACTIRWWEIPVFLIFLVVVVGIVALPSYCDRCGSSKSACINNLRQLDGAKQQWAFENHKNTNAIPTDNDAASYLKYKLLPTCPDRGIYTIGRVDQDPTCSIPEHKLRY
jgi:hypothetical protein